MPADRSEPIEGAERSGVLTRTSLIVATGVYLVLRMRWPAQHAPHVRAGRSVRVRPIFGGGAVFDFANPSFAQAFRELNKRNLAGRP